MKTIHFPLLLFLAVLSANAAAACLSNRQGEIICGGGQCEIDSDGKVFCAEVGGGAVRDIYGVVQCGMGYCAKDYLGKVWCSSQRGGGAAVNNKGEVKCLSGCEPGSTGRCSAGRPGAPPESH